MVGIVIEATQSLAQNGAAIAPMDWRKQISGRIENQGFELLQSGLIPQQIFFPGGIIGNGIPGRPKPFWDWRFHISGDPAGVQKINDAQAQMHQQLPKRKRLTSRFYIA